MDLLLVGGLKQNKYSESLPFDIRNCYFKFFNPLFEKPQMIRRNQNIDPPTWCNRIECIGLSDLDQLFQVLCLNAGLRGDRQHLIPLRES